MSQLIPVGVLNEFDLRTSKVQAEDRVIKNAKRFALLNLLLPTVDLNGIMAKVNTK